MNDYKVIFSYLQEDGQRKYESDITMAYTASDAANEIQKEYADLNGTRIEHVWIDTGSKWEERDFDY